MRRRTVLVRVQNFIFCSHLAKVVLSVRPGEETYCKRVPKEYRAQLIHQAAVTGILKVLLVVAAPDGIESSTLITFQHDEIQSYLRLSCHPTIANLYTWFYSKATLPIDDKELVDLIPLEAHWKVQRLLASHVRLVRAVHCYRIEIDKPIPPNKLFRIGIVNSYDIEKAGADGFCKDVAQAMKCMSSTLHWQQLAAARYLHMCAITTIKLYNVYNYVKWRPKERDDNTKTITNAIKTDRESPFHLHYGT
jgi:hypothetical protein